MGRRLVVPGRDRVGSPARTRTLLVVALALALAGCAGSATPGSGSTSSPGSRTTAPQTPVRAWSDITEAGATTLELEDADWLQVAGDQVWTTLGTPGGGTIQHLDSRTGAKVHAIFNQGADTCTAMDVGYGSLWAALCGPTEGSVVRIDPATGKVLARVRLPGRLVQEEGAIAAGEGSVWVVTALPGRALVQIDPRTARVLRAHRVADGVVGVRAGLGGVWLADAERGELQRWDPTAAKVVATIPVGEEPHFFAVGEGAVWVQNNGAGTVSRVDPTTNSVTATIVVDEGPIEGGDLAVGGGFVWARVSRWLVSKVDPSTNTVVARYGPPAGSGSVAADESAVWVSAHDVDEVYRLPLR